MDLNQADARIRRVAEGVVNTYYRIGKIQHKIEALEASYGHKQGS